MFKLHEVIQFRRFLARQGGRLFLVDQISDTILGLLRRLKVRHGIWRRTSSDEFHDFVISSNHVAILSRVCPCANVVRNDTRSGHI